MLNYFRIFVISVIACLFYFNYRDTPKQSRSPVSQIINSCPIKSSIYQIYDPKTLPIQSFLQNINDLPNKPSLLFVVSSVCQDCTLNPMIREIKANNHLFGIDAMAIANQLDSESNTLSKLSDLKSKMNEYYDIQVNYILNGDLTIANYAAQLGLKSVAPDGSTLLLNADLTSDLQSIQECV
eukprot:NODE_72_length_24857_cov_0.454399.p15 type:complete len:182 gc:universal NODE_72_length_24857_cov_0.454399:5534-6079(+)